MKTKKNNKKGGGVWSFFRRKNKVKKSSNNKPQTVKKRKRILDILFGNLCTKKATLIKQKKASKSGILYKACKYIFSDKFDEEPDQLFVSAPPLIKSPVNNSLQHQLIRFAPENYGKFIQENNGCYIFAVLQLLYTIPELRQLLKTINLDKIVKSELKSVKIFPADFDKAKKLIDVLKNIFKYLEKGLSFKLTEKYINNNYNFYNYLQFLSVYIIGEVYGNQGDSDQVIMTFFSLLKVLLNNEIIRFFIKKLSYSEIKTKKCKQGTQIINRTGTMSDKYASELKIIPENIAIEEEIYNLDQMNISIKLPIEGENIQECLKYYQSFSSENDFEIIDGKKLIRSRIVGCEDTHKNPDGEVIQEDTQIIMNDDFKYIFIELNRFDSSLNKIDTIVTANKIITINDIEFIIQAVVYHHGTEMLKGGHYTCINFNEDGTPLSHIDSDGPKGPRTTPYLSNKTVIDNMINTGYIYLYRRKN